jgi:hypothetical protein
MRRAAAAPKRTRAVRVKQVKGLADLLLLLLRELKLLLLAGLCGGLAVGLRKAGAGRVSKTWKMGRGAAGAGARAGQDRGGARTMSAKETERAA